MSSFTMLVKRNIKLYFKDKAMFFTSLITPAILLVLYATFLANVYRDSFTSNLPDDMKVSQRLIEGTVSGQLVSSLLAVCCITVAFCSNFIMVQDKVTGARADLLMSPVRKHTVALAYYIANFLTTLTVCFAALALGLVYIACTGWFLSFADVAELIADVVLTVLFGTALSSVVNHFLSSQGQMSAVGTIVSAGYGFLCGAYMPIAQFGEGLQAVLSFLPGTYATSLIRNAALNGCFSEMSAQGFPAEVVGRMKASIDCELQFFGNDVSVGAMYGVLSAGILLLVGIYVAVNFFHGRKISSRRAAAEGEKIGKA